jgi:hypothetical protein
MYGGLITPVLGEGLLLDGDRTVAVFTGGSLIALGGELNRRGPALPGDHGLPGLSPVQVQQLRERGVAAGPSEWAVATGKPIEVSG